MGKFCAKCGSAMDTDATFCANCGESSKGTVVKKEETTESNVSRSNGFATAGFILSFFVPVLGLVFSIIGLNKANQWNGAGRGLAKAGLILSIIWIALIVVIYIIYILALAAGATSYYY